MICKIDGCDRTAGTGRGMCHKHYKRWQINGHAKVNDTIGKTL